MIDDFPRPLPSSKIQTFHSTPIPSAKTLLIALSFLVSHMQIICVLTRKLMMMSFIKSTVILLLPILLLVPSTSQSLRFHRDLAQQQKSNFNATNDVFGDSPQNTNSNFQSNQMSNNNFQNINVLNNGCEYNNGYIRENGGPPRKATPAEETQVHAYMQQMEQYQEQMQRGMANQMQQMQQQMSQMFAPPFPFGSNQRQQQPQPMVPSFQMPQVPMPHFPCFCETCKRQAPGNGGLNNNQYSVMSQQMGGGQNVRGRGQPEQMQSQMNMNNN